MYKVLIVDDSPDQTELMRTVLTKLGIQCFMAYSGEEAVSLAKRILPDVIVMDWIMPSETLTGYDATQQILADIATHNIPVIACSAVAERHQVVAHGCVDFIPKPFKLDVLLSTVRNHLP